MRKVIVSVTVTAALIAAGLFLTQSVAMASGPVLTWSTRASMPTARYSMATAVTSDGDLIAFGGLLQPGANVTGAVERFHPATDSWASLAPMPNPRHNAAAVTATDGTILVVGGFPIGGDSTNLVEAYDPVTDTWSSRASLPTPAAGAGGVRGPDGTIYVIGGYPGCCFTYLSSVYAYDQVHDTWTARAPMPTPRQSPGAALAADGKIYVVGGNGTGPINHTVEAYDPATNTWQSKAPMPLGGNPTLVAAPNGKLYAFGYDDLGTVLEYDTATDTWTSVEPMPTPRQVTAAALAGDGNIYIAGGYLPTAAQTTAVTERASFTSIPSVSVYNVAVNTKATSTNKAITATATAAVPAGDTITAAIATGTFAGPVGCADSEGNTYTVVADKNTGSGRLFVCSARTATTLASGDTITATYPGFSGVSVISVNAISGLAATGVDQAATSAGNNASPTSGIVTTPQANEVIFGVVSHNSTPTFSPDAGYTVVGAVTGGSGSGARTLSPEYRLATTTGAYAVTGTLSSGQQWRVAIVTYQGP